MMSQTTVPFEVALDLREYRGASERFDDLRALWDRIEAGLQGQRLEAGRTLTIQVGQDGRASLTVIRADDVEPVGASSRFAVHGVLRAPEHRYRCGTCAGLGTSTYGPFRCEACETSDGTGRVCDHHVVFLDGSTQTSCPLHVPSCACGCGRPATFRCDGDPRSRRPCRPFADHARNPHPTDPLRFYCATCFDDYFSRCALAGCPNLGHLRCEHADPRTLAGCRTRLCPTHAIRWQIWGPHLRGPSYCRLHADLGGGIASVLLQAAVASVPPGRREPALPSLGSLRYGLNRALRGQWISVREIDERLEALARALSARQEEAARRAVTRIEATRPERLAQRRRADDEETDGRALLTRLIALYRQNAQYEVADALRYSGYASARAGGPDREARPACLFVTLDAQFIGRAVGRGGALLRQIEGQLGARVRVEDPSQPGRGRKS